MSNSGKLMRAVSILFVIISVMFLITSIIELCQVNPDDILISVREDGCFKSPEAVIANLCWLCLENHVLDYNYFMEYLYRNR